MNYQDWARLLTLFSAAILSWSSWKQYDWQRTQAQRDEDEEAAREALETLEGPTAARVESPPENSQSAGKKEEVNAARLRLVAARNAARPFFDEKAYRYFLAGFALSALASLIDILWSGTFGRILESVRGVFTLAN